MPTIAAVVETPIHRSYRVDQVAGMFDLDVAKKARQTFAVDVPGLEEPWQIGLIVGPSGSGKSTVAREAYGDRLIERCEWSRDRAVIDGFGDVPVKEIAQVLTSVGFSSPPAWLRPYHVLSNGERFRCDLARALIESRDHDGLVVFDEFTSVVDRTVAKIGSAAVAKAIRKRELCQRFVAVTCHYDVAEWLEADWVLDMASRRLARGRLRRPSIEIQVAAVHRSAWRLFRRHHYLNTSLSRAAKCWCAFWGDVPVAFTAWISRGTRSRGEDQPRWTEHRTVVLPDYQGIGIGNRISEAGASILAGCGYTAQSTTSHPGMIHYRSASPLWERRRLGHATDDRAHPLPNERAQKRRQARSGGRITAGFLYRGPALENATAERLFYCRPRPWLRG